MLHLVYIFSRISGSGQWSDLGYVCSGQWFYHPFRISIGWTQVHLVDQLCRLWLPVAKRNSHKQSNAWLQKSVSCKSTPQMQDYSAVWGWIGESKLLMTANGFLLIACCAPAVWSWRKVVCSIVISETVSAKIQMINCQQFFISWLCLTSWAMKYLWVAVIEDTR